MTVYIPMPREMQGLQADSRKCCFSLNMKKARPTIFALYFASVCHAAAHAKLQILKNTKNGWKGKIKNEHMKHLNLLKIFE